MAKQVASEWRHPVETAKAEIGKAVDTAKQFREQLKKLMDGTGANEEVSIIDRVKAMEDVMTEGEKSRTTYSVAKIKLKNGQKEYWVSTAGKKGYVPPRIRKAAGTEKVANNKVENGNSQNRLNDAEQTILREAKEKGVQIEDIGATRDMCNKCQEAFLEEGLIDKVSTPKK
jgi:hypothetical protein